MALQWKVIEPILALVRPQAGDSMWENFEYLYVKAEDWEKAYGAHGTYPKHMRRVKIAPFSVPPAMGNNGAAHRETADVS